MWACKSIDFTKKHLNQVEPCFAFCIARFEEPLRRWVSSSILFAGSLDTVEDAPWNDKRCQKDQFEQFNHFEMKAHKSFIAGTGEMQFPDAIPREKKKPIRRG